MRLKRRLNSVGNPDERAIWFESIRRTHFEKLALDLKTIPGEFMYAIKDENHKEIQDIVERLGVIYLGLKANQKGVVF